MRKLLIVKPDYRHLPLGLAYVMACLRENGIPYEYADTVFDKTGWVERLAGGEFFAVATGGLCGDVGSIRRIFDLAKAKAPDVATVLGGSITHDCPPGLLMDMMPVEYLVVGECEASMPDLLREIASGRPDPARLRDIRGIAFNDRGNAVATPPARPVSLAKNRLFPVWEDITNIQYYIDLVRVPGLPEFRGLPVLTGRGCTGKCTFCSPTLGTFRTRPVAEVIEELRLHHESGYDFDGFLFLNEMFYPTLKAVREFVDAYRASGIGRPWQCSMRADMPLECLELMKEAGCVIVGVGYESGNDAVLGRMRKRTSTDLVRAFLRKAKEVGLYVYATFMFGSEGEGEAEIAQTMDLLLEEKTYGGGAFVTIYPGTAIYDNAYARGLFTDPRRHLETLDFFNSVVAGNILKPEYVNISDIPDKLELNRAALRHYGRYRGGIHAHFNVAAPDFAACAGACPTCGQPVPLFFYANTLFTEHRSCPRCRHPVFMDFYHHPPFDAHKRALQAMLADKGKVAVVGQGVNALGLLTTDVFLDDPDRVAMVVGEHALHPDGRFLIHPVRPMRELRPETADCVLVADADDYADTARRLADLGLADRAMTVLPPGWPDFVKGVKDGLAEPWETVRFSFPPPGDVHQCRPLYRNVAERLARAHGPGARCCLAPAGAFAVNMADVLEEAGLVVTAFLDNFLEGGTLAGRALRKPAELADLSFADVFLMATPNCRTQERIADGLKARFGEEARRKVVLLADVYLERFIEDFRDCCDVLAGAAARGGRPT